MDFVINLEYRSSVPVYRRASDAIRKAIIEGRLKPGQTMPSVRDLSAGLQISRATVLKAFDDLQKQKYITTISGSGTYVCDPLPGEMFEQNLQNEDVAEIHPVSLSEYGQRVLDMAGYQRRRLEQLAQLQFCGPPLELTPLSKWRQLLVRHCKLRDLAHLAHAREPLGYPPLRDALSAYLHRARGVKYSPDLLVVFASQQFKLEVPARLLIDPGDLVAIEEPGYPDARMCFASHGAKLLNVPIDQDGLDVSYLEKISQPIKCVYVTPSHQDPTGIVMSLERRKWLLDWAARSNTLIIEDDYDSEYRYGNEQLPSLHGLDPAENVIYISSLWKVLFPMVRLGFLVLPKRLLHPVFLAKLQTERNLPLLEQFALTDFINDGYLEKHIKRTTAVYAKRRQALIQSLTRHCRETVVLPFETSGMHLLIQVQSRHSDRRIIDVAAEWGLSLMSTELYYSGVSEPGEFLMPFAHLDEKSLDESVRGWAQFVKS
ncbi:MAG: PLP-dependent aminotransferase family protein [Candidatus Melainabacteria bacterium]|nr:MAG: PLP-dependent aminotransferase family protein [Candidatus Melainabacteria bacterium]